VYTWIFDFEDYHLQKCPRSRARPRHMELFADQRTRFEKSVTRCFRGNLFITNDEGSISSGNSRIICWDICKCSLDLQHRYPWYHILHRIADAGWIKLLESTENRRNCTNCLKKRITTLCTLTHHHWSRTIESNRRSIKVANETHRASSVSWTNRRYRLSLDKY